MIGSVLSERYEIIDVIGEGGMAEVFRALDRRLNREVALKVLHAHLVKNAEFVSRFQQEAAIAAKLEHPNIVTIFDFGIHSDGRAFIVFELIRGSDFHKLEVERKQLVGKPFEPVYCAMVVDEVLKGLQCAHAQNCIHRDVKPDNVMITNEGAVKLTDFGIAKAPASSLTVVGRFIGSPSYSSPEQVQALPIDFRSDIYSTGIILYEALTGVLPFSGSNIADVMMRIAQGKYKRLREVRPDLPAQLDAVVERAMRTNPLERFESADAFAKELRKFLSSVGVEDSRTGLEEYHRHAAKFLEKTTSAASSRNNQEASKVATIERPARTAEAKGVEQQFAGAGRVVRATQAGMSPAQPQPPRMPQNQKREPVGRATVAKNLRRERPPMAMRPSSQKQNSTAKMLSMVALLMTLGLATIVAVFFVQRGGYNVAKRDEDRDTPKSAPIIQIPKTQSKEAPSVASRRSEEREAPRREVEVERREERPVVVAPRRPHPRMISRRPETVFVAPPRPKREEVVTSAPQEAPVTQREPRETTRPEPKKEVPTVAKLLLQSIPAGVSVFIDDQFVGETARGGQSQSFEVRPGSRVLRIQGGNIAGVRYDNFEKRVFVEAGKTVNLGVIKLSAFRTLTIRVSGPGVIVKVNNDPYSLSGPLTLSLPEGRVSIEARASNGKSLKRSIDLKGEDFTLNASLE